MFCLCYVVQCFILYFQKQNKDGSTLWQCSVRNKKTTCTATVNHRGDSFTINNKPHIHESKPGILTNVLLTKKIIETAKADIFTSAPTVVEKILEEDANPKKTQNIPDQTTTT